MPHSPKARPNPYTGSSVELMPPGIDQHASPSVASTADTAERAPKNDSVRSEPEEAQARDVKRRVTKEKTSELIIF